MNIRPLVLALVSAALAHPVAAQDTPESVVAAADPAPLVLEIPVPVDLAEDGPQPIGKRSDWLSIADYPLAAWRNGEEGDVRYDLDVDREGAVTACRISASTATPALDAETCRLLRARATFEPMRDDAGKPVASTYSGRFRWRRSIPEFGGGSFTVRVAFTLDTRGKFQNCRVDESSGAVPDELKRSFVTSPCPGAGDGVPARDSEGRPVARDVVLTIAMESTPAEAGGPQADD